MHMMIDLETLGLGNKPPIMEAGWCLFEPGAEMIHSSGAYMMDVTAQKRQPDLGTIGWWLEQNDTARYRMADILLYRHHGLHTPAEFFMAFAEMHDWKNIEGVWSHGLTFDIPLLTEFYADCGQKVPWHYRTPRDTRTIFWLAGVEPHKGTAHRAEQDAIEQAQAVQKAYRKLKGMDV